MSPLGIELPGPVRRVVSDAWLFRYVIELESQLRFAALAQRLAGAGAPDTLVERARTASSDEERHAAECALYVEAYGGSADVERPKAAREFAPGSLSTQERLTYEMVTTCCVAETQSAGNLVTLYNISPPEPLLTSMRTLSRDEVTHSQLGWAYLEWARSWGSVAFLGPLLPAMLDGGDRRKLLEPPERPELDDPRLGAHGVLPHSTRREVFVSTLTDVMFPGFDRCGVDTAPSRAWLGGLTRS